LDKWKIKKSIIFYNLFLKILSDKKEIEELLEIMKKEEKEGKQHLKFDLYTYTIFVSKISIKKCFELYDDMKKIKLKPDIKFFNSFFNNLKNSKGIYLYLF
jgi:hypothetical protein